MIERPLTPFDATSMRVLATDDLELIEQRRRILRAAHRSYFPDINLFVLPPMRTLPGALWLRELGFAKLALINRGAALLDFWTEIKQERDIPPSVLAWECDVSSLFTRVWGSTFYRTVFTADQDDLERRLNGGRWIFATIEDLPGFSAITEQEALRFYNHIGGSLPHVHHMSVEHVEEHWVGGRASEVTPAISGGVPPYSYALSTDSPAWMAVLLNGAISVAPPVGTSSGPHIGRLVVTDSLGRVVRAPITIILDW